MIIKLHFQKQFSITSRRKLKDHIRLLFEKEHKLALFLNIIFCTDDFLLQINRQYLSHDYYTDIITFPLGVSEKDTSGELYISVERIKENASNLKVSIQAEMLRVVFHGCLHLCGYPDKTVKEKKRMTLKENFYLRSINSFE